MSQKSKFTDRQKKNIVKMYVECQNYRAVAKKYGCSDTTVRRIVESDHDVLKKVEAEKEQNVITVTEHMRLQTEKVCKLLDDILDRIDGDKLEEATAVQLATTLGIIIDKYTKVPGDKDSGGGGVIILPAVE